MTMTGTWSIDADRPLTPALVDEVSREGRRVAASQATMERLQAGAAYLQRLIAERRRVYGVTTGYGPLAGQYIEPEASAELQRNLVYHLASGTGAPLSWSEARAVVLARAQNAAHGHSGLRPETFQLLLDCLNHGLAPAIPERGTVGASGDLTPLAHMSLALMGEGRFIDPDGSLHSAQDVLCALGLQPLDPRGKDAIALVNGTSVMTAIGALGAVEAERALDWALRLGLMNAELLTAHAEAFDPRIGRLRGQPGQIQIHERLAELAGDSRRLRASDGTPATLPVFQAGAVLDAQPLPQDPYSIRCMPQLFGAVADSLRFHRETVTRELGAVTDNPLLLPGEDAVLHGGNFYGQHMAFASDALSNAVIKLGVHAERVVARITDPALNGGRPAFGQPVTTGLRSGFMGAQVTASALVGELRSQAHPASIQSVPTNANNQDVVTMGTIAARKARDSLGLVYEVLAVEAMVLTQMMELEGAAAFSGSSRDVAAQVRTISPFLEHDRPLGEEIQALAAALRWPSTASQAARDARVA